MRLARNALLLGNLVTGAAVLAPGAMLIELAADLHVTIQQAGWLVTLGAIVLCFGSPLMAWATSRVERRTLLTVTLTVAALGNAISVVVPDYGSLLAVRLVLLAVLAIYTPQAAATIGAIVEEKDRAASIAYIFIGWSLAIAFGLPLMNFLAVPFGWRSVYAGLAALAAVGALLNYVGLAARLNTPPVSLKSWFAVAGNRQIVLLLFITILMMGGSFQIYLYLGPLLRDLAGIMPQTVGFAFLTLGIVGLATNVMVTQLIRQVGLFRTSCGLFALMFVGPLIWSAGSGMLAIMLTGAALTAMGTTAGNSVQQARLAAAAPELAGASIALNTSSIYVGQALGSAAGGFLIDHAMGAVVGYSAAAFIAIALILLFFTRRGAPGPHVAAPAAALRKEAA